MANRYLKKGLSIPNVEGNIEEIKYLNEVLSHNCQDVVNKTIRHDKCWQGYSEHWCTISRNINQ